MTFRRRCFTLANSLRGRMIVILFSALFLSYALNNLVFLEDRKRGLRLSHANVVISRTVSLIKSLEGADTKEWPNILKAVNTPFFRPSISLESLIELNQSERGSLHHSFVNALGAFDREARLTFSGGRSTNREFWRKFGLETESKAAWRSLFPKRAGKRPPPPHLQYFLLSTGLSDGTWLNVLTTIIRPRRPWFSPAMVTTALMSIGILAAVTFVFARMTRSLGRLEEAADRFSRGAEVTKLSQDGPTEIRNVIKAFNTMQERLASFVLDRTRMLASISHDLRTPITAMRLRVELLDDDEAKSKISSHLDDLQTMTEAALEFSKQGSSAEPLRKIDLSSVVESVTDDFEQMGKPVSMLQTDRIVYECRPTDIKRMVQNLITNAVDYGGSAKVTLAQFAGRLDIIVDDDGPGIPEDQIEQMFKPFTRLETSRSRQTGGSGLGLSIARSIARGHGGDLTLVNRYPCGPQGNRLSAGRPHPNLLRARRPFYSAASV